MAPAAGCADFRRSARLHRRGLLRLGGPDGFGLLLPDLLRARAEAAPSPRGSFGRAGSAAYPTAHPHDPRDLAATVYHLLGVPADTQVRDQAGRPHALVVGDTIDALLA